MTEANALRGVLQYVEEITNRERRVDPLGRHRLTATLNHVETGKVQFAGGGQLQYELQLRIAGLYWANQAQRPTARRSAELAINDLLYRDVVGRLAQIRSLLDSADRDHVQLAITELIADLRS